MSNTYTNKNTGFTLVEILVVIAVIAILASISVVGYGAWKKTASVAQVKSDLNAVASAMESARTFNDAYPTTLPSTVVASDGVTLSSGVIGTTTAYCVDGGTNPVVSPAIVYYVDSDKGAQIGTCATRPNQTGPGIPANLTILSAEGTSVSLQWTGVSGATGYTAQCASDAGFILGAQSKTVTAPTVTAMVSGLSPSSSYFCRVNATNVNSTSAWSAVISTTTTDAYGSLAVGTSIDGYWTTPPKGFLSEDGSAVSRITYSALFDEILGTTYGAGDGSTTFNLPDSRGRTSVNLSADTEFNVIGEKSGSKTEILTLTQIASHNHVQNAHSHGVSDPGHNHSQNAHTHGQVVTANGGSAIRRDYDSDGAAGAYSQGISTGDATATNNAATTGVYMYNGTATNQNTGGDDAHNNIQPSIVKTSVIKYAPVETATSASLPIASSINGYWSTAPADYLLENGAAVSRTTYSVLFAAIGTTYGIGDGSTTFNVPDSRGRTGVNLSADAEFNVMGEKPGSKTESLTIAQMPSHTHTQNAHTHGIYDAGHNHSQNPHSHGQHVTANSGGTAIRKDWNSDGSLASYPQGVDTYATAATNNGSYTGISVNATVATNQSAGGGGTHNNIQPSIVKLSVIKYTAEVTTGIPIATGTSVANYSSAVPADYLAEDGAAVSRTTYADLFSVLGITYGAGNGSTTFNVPDSRGRISVNKSSDAEFNTMGEKYGEKSHILTIAELASHTHIQDAHVHSISDPGHNHSQNPHVHGQVVSNPLAGWPGIRNDYNADGDGGTYAQGANTYSTTATNNIAGTGMGFNNATAINQSMGGGGAHNEIQPSIVKKYYIKI